MPPPVPKKGSTSPILQLPTLPQIHLTDPHIGKALDAVVKYINKNVTQKPGNKV